ncbi:hypothetical protein BD309DRAFT_838706, partial [Dichomitus squalens]
MALQSKTIEGLIAELVPDIGLPGKSDQYFLERTILSSKTNAVDKLNKEIIANFPGGEIIMHSADKV